MQQQRTEERKPCSDLLSTILKHVEPEFDSQALEKVYKSVYITDTSSHGMGCIMKNKSNYPALDEFLKENDFKTYQVRWVNKNKNSDEVRFGLQLKRIDL